MKVLFYLSPKKMLRWMLLMLGTLLIVSILANYLKWVLKYDTALGFIPLFDFEGEYNIPTFFSFGVLLFNGMLLSSLYHGDLQQGKKQPCWRLFSFVFYFLSLDEMAGIHERIGAITHHLFRGHVLLSSSRFWIFPYTLMLIVFLLVICRFYFSLPRRFQVNFFLAGAIYVSGSIGMELIGEFYMWQVYGKPNLLYSLISTLEESTELLGLILFAHYLIRYMLEKGMHTLEINPASASSPSYQS